MHAKLVARLCHLRLKHFSSYAHAVDKRLWVPCVMEPVVDNFS